MYLGLRITEISKNKQFTLHKRNVLFDSISSNSMKLLKQGLVFFNQNIYRKLTFKTSDLLSIYNELQLQKKF